MSNYTVEQIRQVVQMSSVYCSARDQESIRIDYTNETDFVGTSEESGDSITVYFEDIDLDTDNFYKLVLVDIKTVV